MKTLVRGIGGLVARLLALAAGLLAFAAALVFSAIVFAVLIAVAAAALVYLGLRSRAPRGATDVIDVDSRDVTPRDRP